MATKKEKEHYDRLARFGCILCYHLGYEGTPAELHHIRRGGRRDNAPVIPLCPEHHRGNSSIHGLGRKLFERTFKTTEEELLEMVSAKFPPPSI
jgi:hypothetical protein